jgi:AraC-like DNA-binding protein
MNVNTTTLSSWGLLIAKALKDYGIDPLPFFKEAGLDPQKMHEARERYSTKSLQQLWRLAVDATDDSSFGLKVAQHWHPTTFCALGYAWLASKNLKDAMERAVRYSHAVSDMVDLSLQKAGGAYKLSIEYIDYGLEPVPESVDAAIASIVVMTREAYCEEINPVLVILPRKKPGNARTFSEFFHSPIEYEAKECSLLFNEEEIEKPLPTANAELALMTDKVIEDYLASLDQNVFTMQVKSKLIDRLPSGIATEQNIANALNISPSTLKKKLDEDGSTFTEILDETRHELANKYIKEGEISLEEIAFLLGFTDPDKFRSVLEQWKIGSSIEIEA